MDKLTRNQAIEKTEEMWAELAETGGSDKHSTKAYQGHKGSLLSGCFLCEYVGQTAFDTRCRECPYYQQFHGRCHAQNRPYSRWEEAWGTKARKKNAKLFLEQVRQLKEVNSG